MGLDLRDRFEDKGVKDVVEQFNKIQQGIDESEEKYAARFKVLKSLILLENASYTENYFIFSFVSGLLESYKPTIKFFKPKSLKEAIESVRIKE